MLHRGVEQPLAEALALAPAVLLQGCPGSGTTTLGRAIASARELAYVTLDDPPTLARVARDPSAFVRSVAARSGAVVDAVERLPGLIGTTCETVAGTLPGRFVLVSRERPRLDPGMPALTLWPFSQGEIAGVRDGFVDAIFADEEPDLVTHEDSRAALVTRMLAGGFPAARGLAPEDRGAWMRAYLAELPRPGLQAPAGAHGRHALPRLLGLLASRTAGSLELGDMSRTAGIPATTLTRHTTALEDALVLTVLPAWHGPARVSLSRSGKAYVADTALMAHLIGIDEARAASEPSVVGALLEDLAVMELVKQSGWSRTWPALTHFRTRDGVEVDVVLEDDRGRLVAVEVKAAADLGPHDFKGVRVFAEATGERFHRAVVLYTGPRSVRIDASVYAMPVGALWTLGAEVVTPAPEK